MFLNPVREDSYVWKQKDILFFKKEDIVRLSISLFEKHVYPHAL